MKNIFTLLLVFILLAGQVKAQTLIALDHANGGSQFFHQLDSALVYAENNDIIYIPGGTFNIGNLIIDKSVHLIGAGINPDSSSVTGITILNGNIFILTGADNGSLTGFYLTNNLYFGNNGSNHEVGYYSIARCSIGNVDFCSSCITTSSNIEIRECILRGTFDGGNSNASITNCIFQSWVSYLNGALIDHCIFLNGNYVFMMYVLNTTIQNNFFNSSCVARYSYYSGGAHIAYCQDNYYYNNITTQTIIFYGQNGAGGSCGYGNNGIGLEIGNIVAPMDSIFSATPGSTYDYTSNYQLLPYSPGKNAATDGTDIGIYGGATPFKDGSLPFNPQIRFKQIGNATNADGSLDVHIKVEAQER